MSKDREFNFTTRDFNDIRELVSHNTGIVLSDAKQDMVYSRLAKRLRKLGLKDFKDYCALIKSENSEEISHFVNAVTTNLTSFFRENHHFEYLKSTLLPELLSNQAGQKQLRIWSSGCSTGEEPYSISMALKEALVSHPEYDAKLLATDLDTNVLDTACQGIYNEDRVNGISKERLKRWFLKGKESSVDKVKVSSELQDMITFRQLNLMNKWPMRGLFDIIFCRNVVIYFDKPTQRLLFDRYADILAPGGHLFIGHSETLYKITDRFELIGSTIYRKVR
ncbi:MAG: protein-glutamate O-methyltransferase CheR [Gammaproteobacteria bacterium]|nr:protein-glutamate O-methyltransferase CheR [Gammaproteobacteria bacterium]